MASGDVVNLEAWSRGLLGDAQLEHIANLAAWCQRAAAAAQEDDDEDDVVGDQEAHISSSSNAQQPSTSAIALPTAPITSSSALLPWLESIKSSTAPTIASSSASPSLAPLVRIDEAARRTTALLSQLESARINVAELKAGSRSIEETSEELRTESESGGRGGGAHGSRSLARLVDEIDAQLSYYAVLPQATTFLSSPKIVPVVLSQRFATTLAQCDVGYSFVKARPHYRDAAIYRLRFEHCLTRGGTLARMWIVSRFKELGTDMGVQIKERTKAAAADKEDNSQHAVLDFASPKLLAILYRDLLSAAPEIQSTLVEITKRCTRGKNGRRDSEGVDGADAAEAAAAEPLDEDSMLQDYRADSDGDGKDDEAEDPYRPNTFAEFDTLLADCQNAYFDSRRGALLPLISAALARIEGRAAAAAATSSTESPLVVFLEEALQLLTPILASEYLLYAQIFDLDDGNDANANAFLASLCKDLADRLHPRIYAESRLGELARLAACVLEASTAGASPSDRSLPCLFSLQDAGNASLPHRERLPLGQDSDNASRTWLRMPLVRPLYDDIAARLTFRARAVLQGRDVAGHQATNEELLAAIAALKERAGLTGKGKGSTSSNRRKARESLGVGVLQAAAQRALEEHEREHGEQPPIALFSVPSAKTLSTWHSSVSRSLRILSMLHPVLTRSQLAEVGIEAVEAARAGLARQPAVAALTSKKSSDEGKEATASRIEVALWKLRQALLLREVSASVDLSLAQPSKADEVLLLQQRRRASSLRGGAQALDVGAVTKVVAGLLDAVRRGFGAAPASATTAAGGVGGGGALAQDVAACTRVVLDEVRAAHGKTEGNVDVEEELHNLQRLVACFVEDDEQVVESVMRGVVREMMAAAPQQDMRVMGERLGLAMGEEGE